jgi:hypothetical protein
MLEPDLDRQYRAKDRPYLDGIEWTLIKNMCDLAEGLPLIAQERSFARRRSDGKPCPECMDRLPFASEGVLSEVADMYPAC